MYSEKTSGRGCSTMVIVLAILGFIALGTWWVESRFNAGVAAMVLGGLAGVACVIVGYVLNMASTSRTLDAAARFNEALAVTEKHRQLTYREHAKGDAAWQKTNAQLTLLDARRVDQLAQQRAGLLMDNERKQNNTSADWWQAPSFDEDGE